MSRDSANPPVSATIDREATSGPGVPSLDVPGEDADFTDPDAHPDDDGDDLDESHSASRSGLIGGDLEVRAKTSRVPPIAHPFVLAPYRKEGDDEAFRAFASHLPLHIEVGFGRPHYLLDLARAHPEAHVIGFEIKREWVRAAAERATRDGLTNIRVIEGDARPHLERLVTPGTVDGIHVLFPDPWWKKRHHKRRVFTPEFTALFVKLLAPTGMLVAKTDVPAYVDQMIDACLAAGLELAGQGSADPILAALPRSHREKKCLEFEVPFHMLRFTRTTP